MDKIIINYRKEWGNDGTVYDQTIKLNKKILKNFNDYVKKRRENIINNFKHSYSNEEMKILYYTEELKENQKNYCTLTMLQLFIDFYLKTIYTPPKKDLTFERILWRNTIIKTF